MFQLFFQQRRLVSLFCPHGRPPGMMVCLGTRFGKTGVGARSRPTGAGLAATKEKEDRMSDALRNVDRYILISEEKMAFRGWCELHRPLPSSGPSSSLSSRAAISRGGDVLQSCTISSGRLRGSQYALASTGTCRCSVQGGVEMEEAELGLH